MIVHQLHKTGICVDSRSMFHYIETQTLSRMKILSKGFSIHLKSSIGFNVHLKSSMGFNVPLKSSIDFNVHLTSSIGFNVHLK